VRDFSGVEQADGMAPLPKLYGGGKSKNAAPDDEEIAVLHDAFVCGGKVKNA
jgi:hypothetical protein